MEPVTTVSVVHQFGSKEYTVAIDNGEHRHEVTGKRTNASEESIYLLPEAQVRTELPIELIGSSRLFSELPMWAQHQVHNLFAQVVCGASRPSDLSPLYNLYPDMKLRNMQ